MKIKDLPTPCFVVNKASFQKNCTDAIVQATEICRARLRPHVKTHKTIEGALLQAGYDADSRTFKAVGFVASTIPEIRLLATAGKKYGGPFLDIIYGLPIAESKVACLHSIRRETNSVIHFLVDNPRQLDFLEAFSKSLQNGETNCFSIFIKVDTGYHRAGVEVGEEANEIVRRIIMSPFLSLAGIYSHCGHAYDENNSKALDEVAKTDQDLMVSFALEIQKTWPNETKDIVISVGSTPSLSHHRNDGSIANLEIHPGNYTFFDRQQLWTGACRDRRDIACRVIATVIGVYPDRFLLDAGATALTKDETPQGGKCEIDGYPDVECYAMSQEVIKARPPVPGLPIGSLVKLIPNHSCLAAACFDRYFVIDDPSGSFSEESEILCEWIPVKFF